MARHRQASHVRRLSSSSSVQQAGPVKAKVVKAKVGKVGSPASRRVKVIAVREMVVINAAAARASRVHAIRRLLIPLSAINHKPTNHRRTNHRRTNHRRTRHPAVIVPRPVRLPVRISAAPAGREARVAKVAKVVRVLKAAKVIYVISHAAGNRKAASRRSRRFLYNPPTRPTTSASKPAS